MADTQKKEPRPITDGIDGIKKKLATLDDSKNEYKRLMVRRRGALARHRKNLEESVQIRATDLAVRINVRG